MRESLESSRVSYVVHMYKYELYRLSCKISYICKCGIKRWSVLSVEESDEMYVKIEEVSLILPPRDLSFILRCHGFLGL